MSELDVAWPPMPPLSTTRVLKPSDAPYTAADRPAGPAPTMTTSKSIVSGSTGDPAATAISALVGFSRTGPVGEHDDRELAPRRRPRRRARAPRRSRRGRSCGRWRTAGAPRAARRPGPTTTRRRCGSCTAPPGATRPSRAACRRSSGGTARRATGGPQHVVVEAALGDAVEDRLARGLLAPVAPRDQQGPHGVRVEAADLAEQLAAGGAVEPRPGQDQGDLHAGGGALREARTGRRRASAGTRPGSAGRTGPPAPARPRPASRVVVHREQHRPGHGGALYGVNPIAQSASAEAPDLERRPTSGGQDPHGSCR